MKDQIVKKAIIIGAGLGSRMYPYTKVESKLMIPILNKPFIEYLIDELVDSGIKEVVIISNHISKINSLFSKDQNLDKILIKIGRKDLLKKVNSKIKINWHCIQEELPLGWLHEILASEQFVKNGPFAVLFSDVLYHSRTPATAQLIKQFQKTNKNQRSLGRFVFKPNVINLIKSEDFELGKDLADLDLFKKLCESNELSSYAIKGTFLDIGDPLSLLKTITFLSLKDNELKKPYRTYLKSILK